MTIRKVQMMTAISGSRADGRPWPPAGHPLEVEDWEAEHLIRGGNARPWPGEEEPSRRVSYTEAGVQDSPPEPVREPEAPPGPAPAVPPKSFAPKQSWVDWAVAQGMGEDEAAASTKADLMEQYGERS